MIRERATVLTNEPCYEGGYVLWLDAPALAAAGHTPGQFVMVHCAPEGGSPEFARAFSYHRAGEGRIALLYAVAGRGTGWLAGRRRGDAVSLAPSSRLLAASPAGEPFGDSRSAKKTAKALLPDP